MSEPINVRIADRDYTLACEPGERELLLDAAQLLDRRMRETRADNRMLGTDRIAVLVALNLALELLQCRNTEKTAQQDVSAVLNALSLKLDRLLALSSIREPVSLRQP